MWALCEVLRKGNGFRGVIVEQPLSHSSPTPTVHVMVLLLLRACHPQWVESWYTQRVRDCPETYPHRHCFGECILQESHMVSKYQV